MTQHQTLTGLINPTNNTPRLPRFLNADNSEAWSEIYSLIYEKTGLDLNSYRSYQIIHWLLEYSSRFNCTTFEDFKHLLHEESFDIEDLIGSLLINSSEPFRDQELWDELKIQLGMIPIATFKGLCAGCSNGCEAASLVITAHQHLPLQSINIVGIDRDQKALNHASEGKFSIFPSHDLHTPYESFFHRESSSTIRIAAEIIDRIQFRNANLLTDDIGDGYDVICFRNVSIYLSEEATTALHEKLALALNPGGILFLGKSEFVHDPAKLNLEKISPSLYRKLS